MLNRYSKLAENGATVRTEVIAGITAFLTMAYIIFVNLAILKDAGIDHGAAFTAACLAAATASAIMGLYANAMPLTFSIATGIGLGFVTYAAVKLLSGRARDASFATYVIAAAFGVKFAFF